MIFRMYCSIFVRGQQVSFIILMWSSEKLQIACMLKLSILFFFFFPFQLVNSNFGSVKPTARAQLVQWYHLVLELSLALIYSPWTPHRQGTNSRLNKIGALWSVFCLSSILYNPHNIDAVFVMLLSRRPWHLCTPTVISISPHSRKQESFLLCLNLRLLCDFWVMPTPMPCTICFPNSLLRDSTEWVFLKLKSHPTFWGPLPCCSELFMYIVFAFVCTREIMGLCKCLIVKTVCLITVYVIAVSMWTLLINKINSTIHLHICCIVCFEGNNENNGQNYQYKFGSLLYTLKLSSL